MSGNGFDPDSPDPWAGWRFAAVALAISLLAALGATMAAGWRY